MKKKMQLISILVIILLILSCKRIIKSESKKVQNKKQDVIVELEVKSDKLYSEAKKCVFYCNQDSAEMRIDEGYIITEISFDSNENIPFGKSLPFTPKKGKKNVLFIHFQPNFKKFENGCPSSNLVLFLELESLQNNEPIRISKNLQFAMFTGGSFYKFETKGETKGEIQITGTGEGIVNVNLKLEFGLTDENITRLELDSKLTIIKQKDVN